MDEQEYHKSQMPRVVTCRRGNLEVGLSYDAEISWQGKHYAVGTGFSTYGEAKAHGENILKPIFEALFYLGNKALSKYPEAKP